MNNNQVQSSGRWMWTCSKSNHNRKCDPKFSSRDSTGNRQWQGTKAVTHCHIDYIEALTIARHEIDNQNKKEILSFFLFLT